jgi:hypothetical protein
MKVKTLPKHSLTTFFVIAVTTGVCLTGISSGEPAEKVEKTPEERLADTARREASLPATIEDARGRARWMHEGFHGALQVMHRDFFDDDEAGTLPSQSLDDVFKEMARSWAVEIRWLGVNATKGIDHEPKDRFEERAAAALAAGEIEFEQIEAGRYRYVGMIRLQNECLKCHVRNRTTNEDRVAGLAISFPMKSE